MGRGGFEPQSLTPFAPWFESFLVTGHRSLSLAGLYGSGRIRTAGLLRVKEPS